MTNSRRGFLQAAAGIAAMTFDAGPKAFGRGLTARGRRGIPEHR